MAYTPILTLPDGPIDIIGDVHGHLQPLLMLLEGLGYDRDGRHPEGRRIVFLGDLGDRGPDSPGVFRLVMRAVTSGDAVCLLGNHELALIDTDEAERQKAGNAWFFGDPDKLRKDEHIFGAFEQVDAGLRDAIEAFCDTLPLVVEHPLLTMVHACWDPASIEFVRSLGAASNRELIAASNARAVGKLSEAGLERAFPASKRNLEASRRLKGWAPDQGLSDAEQRQVANLIPGELIEQGENPVRVLTAGFERRLARPVWLGGKWRFLERVPWWQGIALDRPVVFGHYWRQREHVAMHPYDEHAVLFGTTRAQDWLGAGRMAMCIDYCWPREWGRAALAAYRPDLGELVFYDGERVPSRWG